MRKLEKTEEIKTLEDLEIDGANQTHNRKQYILDALTNVIYWAIIVVPIFAAVCIIIASGYYIWKNFQIFTDYLIEARAQNDATISTNTN